MKRASHRHVLLTVLLTALCTINCTYGQVLKSIVYDFDGFDLGLTSLPEGDYSYGDLSYQVASNPLSASAILGDRVLRMDLNWSANYGAFGRGITRYVEMDQLQDRINFYFYNPSSNQQNAVFEIAIGDDDNQNNIYESSADDSWRKTFTISATQGWILQSVPLTDLTDSNTGGNGIFDIGFSQNKGMLMQVEFRFAKPAGAISNPTFYIDMICFTEGAMPTGNTPLELPSKSPSDYCRLGAHQKENPGEYYLIPSKFRSLFPVLTGRKLKYVNTYLQWGADGTANAGALPGNGYQILIDSGYTPILTWEPMFKGFAPLDPVQPRLSNIINGDYDTYIDNFADKLKQYSDTIIIRLMHEFDGDWYPWCVSQNNQDPTKFIAAYRRIVDRVKAKGASKVKWMWCPNNDYTPYRYWNWVVSAYPGDNYVDIVATDVYNAHYPANLPWWRSFRWQTTEIYYYLTRYFPTKPFFICELACRERTSAENTNSQSKAGWIAEMDKELQSDFRKIRAIIFFNENKLQTWEVNTSTASFESLRDNIWADDYYFITGTPASVPISENLRRSSVYPNPANELIKIENSSAAEMQLLSINGDVIKTYKGNVETIDVSDLPSAVYLVKIISESRSDQRKIVVIH
jgi:hypothetical protein